ncbi:acid-sensing ion channel 1 [Caerostris darwini]|uniref:Acid-sensing ion channel 1 n=1 Tax=Caerostris darwini TaxID=1538125 RepID=A0AAV4R8Y4_9ARAC|nr:acid-sensing ion channel 1 [Caerostris darwini]
MEVNDRIQNSSVYAISQIGYSKTSCSKITWISILTCALIGCCYQIYGFTDQYFKYPVIVDLLIEQPETITFPAVTVCNLNRMKSEYEPCLYKFDALEKCHSLPGPPGSVRGSLSLSERQSIRTCKTHFRGKQHKDTDSYVEFLDKYFALDQDKHYRFGHKVDELVMNCSFNGKSCNSTFFWRSWNFRYGNCYTINGSKQMLTSAASSKGLELILHVKPKDYVSVSHTIGMRIVIHNPVDNADPEGNGINIFPGCETDISLSQTIIRRLPAPYKDKCVSYANNPFYQSQAQCMQHCIQEYNYKQCGCVEPSLPSKFPVKRCTVKNSTELCCLDAVINSLAIHGTECKCPLPCVTTYYNERLTMAKWPSNAFFLKEMCKSAGKDIKTYRKSHAKVRISFSTFAMVTYEQKPVFLESEIFSHLGGELGLWLGLSLIAVFELLEVFLYFCNRKI